MIATPGAFLGGPGFIGGPRFLKELPRSFLLSTEGFLFRFIPLEASIFRFSSSIFRFSSSVTPARSSSARLTLTRFDFRLEPPWFSGFST